MDKNYVKIIEKLAKSVERANSGIQLATDRPKVRPPGLASSEFLTHRQQGDWAEDLVIKLLNKNLQGVIAVPYGRSEDLSAGDVGFKDFFIKYQKELDEIGKCPDVLLFKKDVLTSPIKSQISDNQNKKEIISIVQKADAALEVRSSAYIVKNYNDFYDHAEKEEDRKSLSFTVKVEDLKIVIKWIEIHQIPHYYVQVFFDSIYVISFKKILEILSNPENKNEKYSIDRDTKNQFKTTIKINIDEGTCIYSSLHFPKSESQRKILEKGRVLHFVKLIQEQIPEIKDSILKETFALR
jgi:hypothetical protein